MLGPLNTQNVPMPPPSAVSATSVLVVSPDHPASALPNSPIQWVISAATTVKKSPTPSAGLPTCASPENAFVMSPVNSLFSNGVGSINQPLVSLAFALPLPAPIVIDPALGLPPCDEVR